MTALSLLDRGLVPDWVIRLGIRKLLRKRLRDEDHGSDAALEAHMEQHVRMLARGPIAVRTEAANEQHYEVPAAFFERVLGAHMKYSCGLWDADVGTLDEAEERMLALTVERAGIEDGLDVLELGCGWGSLTLYMAERYPRARIQAVSNSHGQREYIERQCALRGITNVQIITEDINDFEPEGHFDRVVSVEMFEHVRNYEALLRRVRHWLRPEGLLFVHVFVHKTHAYLFGTDGAANWLGRHFFTGGQMPSADLLTRFPDDMEFTRSWAVDGTHYARTARAWLERLDAQKPELLALLADGDEPADVLLRRWRVFFMACEELWKYRDGSEWYVQHYLFRPAAGTDRGQAKLRRRASPV